MSTTDVDRIDDALRAVDLARLADRPLPALSSGERQRVAVARCLAQGGDLVLLDEPTSHLDLGHRVRLLALFRRRARREGVAVLAALHDLNLAAAVADRVVLLVAGRVLADGSPGTVLTRETVESAFGARVHVVDHPDSGAPVLVPATSEERS
jgi:iron complex transport system ATP-binding protein